MTLSEIPDDPMSVRAAGKYLSTNAYGVMKLIAEGALRSQKVYDGTGKHRLQVFGDSVRAYLERQAAPTLPVGAV
ncbi:hypothetical protein [Gemmatimonas sp.]